MLRTTAAFAALLSAAAETPTFPRGLLQGVRYDNETDLQLKLQQNAIHLRDWRAGNATVSNGCTGGLKNVQVCYQICDEWCWATVTTMTSDYYKGQNYCEGFECAVASREFGQQCCPWSNSCSNTPNDPQTTCNSGGTPQQMADAAGYYTGGPFSVYGALNQADLDNALNSGRVVMIAVYWQGGGGHALIIGGCDNGMYYLHDPWGWYQNAPPQWQSLSYDQLLQYTAPNGGVGSWSYSIMWSTGAEAEQAHAAKLESAAAARAEGKRVVV